MHDLILATARNWTRAILLGILIGCLTIAGGCAGRPINGPITKTDQTSGYRVLNKLAGGDSNDRRTLFIVAFSGGGTRAAAFSYGVLEELRRTQVTVDGRSHRLIDEIDILTGVSGGSFTALSYALHGERLFSEYEARFLKRDVEGDIIFRVLNPIRWPKLIGGTYGRSELAADYYDEILFEGATFDDLNHKPGPFALVTGTDLSTGSRLAFSQSYFDLLCSDLGKVRLSRAAATSSAVPSVLSPVTFNNYGGSCGYRMPAFLDEILNPDNRGRPAGRALLRYREMIDFQDSKTRPFIHLVDGGISDNLGIRGIVETMEEMEASPTLRKAHNMNKLRRVVVIVVNSRSSPSTDWDKQEKPPGILSQIFQSSSVPIDLYSYESVELLKDIVARWAMRRELLVARSRLAGKSQADAEANIPTIEMYAIDVSFAAISDEASRRFFMNLPTSFVLPASDVDRLRDMGGKLLRDSVQYQKLIRSFSGETPVTSPTVSE